MFWKVTGALVAALSICCTIALGQAHLARYETHPLERRDGSGVGAGGTVDRADRPVSFVKTV